MTNYSPISLSTVSSKVLEKAASGRLSQNQCPKNILVTERYGFWKGISTENSAFFIFKSVNQKVHFGGIFCDLAKALDCFNYEILLSKLHLYGI